MDQHPLLRQLVSVEIPVSEYVRIIQLLQHCFRLIEPALTSYEKLDLNPDFFPYTRMAEALSHDLQHLGVNEEQVAANINPIQIDSIGAYLGTRYVLEGSAQGGAFIANHLEKSSPELCGKAFEFWSLQRQASEKWPKFLLKLAQLDGDDHGQQQAVQAAIESFDLFLSVFDKVSHEPLGR